MRVSDYELTTLAAGLPPPDGDFDRVLTAMARELLAARKVIEAVREYDLPPGLRRDPLGNGYVPVQHALREYDAGESEAQPEPADKHYFGRYSRLMEAVLAALDKEAGR